MFRQSGANVLPLSGVLDDLYAGQENSKRSHYLAGLVHAKWVWKSLVRSTVFSVNHMVVDVVDGRIVVPNGVERVLSIKDVDDCNNTRALTLNPNINTIR